MGLTGEALEQMQVATGALILRSGGSAWYVGIGHASQVLRWLHDRGYRVMGFEGFVCDGCRVRPVEGCVADLSDAPAGDYVNAAHLVVAEWEGHVEWLDFSPIVAGK